MTLKKKLRKRRFGAVYCIALWVLWAVALCIGFGGNNRLPYTIAWVLITSLLLLSILRDSFGCVSCRAVIGPVAIFKMREDICPSCGKQFCIDGYESAESQKKEKWTRVWQRILIFAFIAIQLITPEDDVKISSPSLLWQSGNPAMAIHVDIDFWGEIDGDIFTGGLTIAGDQYLFDDKPIRAVWEYGAWTVLPYVAEFNGGKPQFRPFETAKYENSNLPDIPFVIFADRHFRNVTICFADKGSDSESLSWDYTSSINVTAHARTRDTALVYTQKVAKRWNKVDLEWK